MNFEELTSKLQQLKRLRPLSNELLRNLDDWFRVELKSRKNYLRTGGVIFHCCYFWNGSKASANALPICAKIFALPK